MHLKIDFVNTGFFFFLSFSPRDGGALVWKDKSQAAMTGNTQFFSARSRQAHFQSISYISPRQLLVVGKEFVSDVWWNFFRLQPESHSASLHNLIGQLSFQRDDWRREEKFWVQIQCCNYLLITKAEKRGEEITGRVNDRKAGDAKAGKAFFIDKKKIRRKKGSKKSQNKAKWWREKGRSGEKKAGL